MSTLVPRYRRKNVLGLAPLALLGLIIFLPALALGGTDFYKVLGIKRGANDNQIKRAYRKQALKWHPDKHPDNEEKATERFEKVAKAYEVLSDPEKRRIYDQVGEEGLDGNGNPHGGGPSGSGGGGPGFGGQGGPGGGGGPGMHFSFSGGPGVNFGASAFDMFERMFGQRGAGGGMFGGMGMGGGGGGGGGSPPRGGRGRGRGRNRGPPPPLFPKGSAVQQLSAAGMRKVGRAGRGRTVWLLAFLDSDDQGQGGSREVAGALVKAAEALQGAARVGVVDCGRHGKVCQAQGIQEVPHIKVLGPDRAEEYRGNPASARKLRDAAVDALQEAENSFRVRVSGAGQAQLRGLKRRCARSASGCGLLLSSSQQPSARLLALAGALRDREEKGGVTSGLDLYLVSLPRDSPEACREVDRAMGLPSGTAAGAAQGPAVLAHVSGEEGSSAAVHR